MLKLNWKTCGDDRHWCDFKNLDLGKITDIGVYMIWHQGDPSCVVRVGQGKISERIADHRDDPEITQYDKIGALRVTWASVESHLRDGVEAYLADTWNPLVGDRWPAADPIAVNNPFE